MKLFNAYSFTRTHERVIIDMGLPYEDALRKCEFEAAFIESMGDKLTRFGDADWLADGMVPRIFFVDTTTDPFRDKIKNVVWLPDSDEL
jgi:hypothetical protein